MGNASERKRSEAWIAALTVSVSMANEKAHIANKEPARYASMAEGLSTTASKSLGLIVPHGGNNGGHPANILRAERDRRHQWSTYWKS